MTTQQRHANSILLTLTFKRYGLTYAGLKREVKKDLEHRGFDSQVFQGVFSDLLYTKRIARRPEARLAIYQRIA